MFKKIFSTILLALALFAGGHAAYDSEAEAADVWVYTDQNGISTYIMTNTIKKQFSYEYIYEVDVKRVNAAGQNVRSERYDFGCEQRVWYAVANPGRAFIHDVYDGNHGMLAAVLNWLRNN